MTIPLAETQTNFEINCATDSTVGPGKYLSQGTYEAKSELAPFSTSKIRDTEEIIPTPQAHLNPGPGSYLPIFINTRAELTANSFKTTIPRFAPNAPLSTIFTPGTPAITPGPGTYDLSLEQYPPSQSRPRTTEDKVPEVQIFAGKQPSSIPGKEDSLGYNIDNQNRLIKRHPSNEKEMFTGLKTDTVGPGQYDYTVDTVKLSPRYHDIDKDINRPELWKPTHEKSNWLPDINNPGPGKYDPPIQATIPYSVHTADSPNYKSLPFQSDQPMAYEMFDKEAARRPGPGHYEVKDGNKPSGDVDMSVFGSNADRVGWNRILETPFFDPSSATAPGPGTYAEVRSSFKPPTVDPDAPPEVIVPFDNHEIREVCEPVIKTDKPGPGTYEDKPDIELLSNKKTMIGRFGVFGTRADRIRPDTFEVPKDLVKPVPGPGYYNPNDKFSQRLKKNACYESNLDRLGHYTIHNTPMIVQLNRDKITPGVGDYELDLTLSGTNSMKRRGFNSTGKRFDSKHVLGVAIHPVPGPGNYETNDSFALEKKNDRNINRRFCAGVNNYREFYTPQRVGPGSYNLERSIGKKSFNVIYTKKYGGRPLHRTVPLNSK